MLGRAANCNTNIRPTSSFELKRDYCTVVAGIPGWDWNSDELAPLATQDSVLVERNDDQRRNDAHVNVAGSSSDRLGRHSAGASGRSPLAEEPRGPLGILRLIARPAQISADSFLRRFGGEAQPGSVPDPTFGNGAGQMIRVGVVGLGKMGLSHLSIINAHPDVKVAGVCDSAKYVLEVLEQDTPRWRPTPTSRRCSTRPSSTPSSSPPPPAPTPRWSRQRWTRGLHVFCEKPLTLERGRDRPAHRAVE